MLRLDKMQTTDSTKILINTYTFSSGLLHFQNLFAFFFVCSFLHFTTVTNKTSISVKGNTSIKIMTKENESQKKKKKSPKFWSNVQAGLVISP